MHASIKQMLFIPSGIKQVFTVLLPSSSYTDILPDVSNRIYSPSLAYRIGCGLYAPFHPYSLTYLHYKLQNAILNRAIIPLSIFVYFSLHCFVGFLTDLYLTTFNKPSSHFFYTNRWFFELYNT